MIVRKLFDEENNIGICSEMHMIEKAAFDRAVEDVLKEAKSAHITYKFGQIGLDESSSLLKFETSENMGHIYKVDGDVITASARLIENPDGWYDIDKIFTLYEDEGAFSELVKVIENVVGPYNIRMSMTPKGHSLEKRIEIRAQYEKEVTICGYVLEGDYAVKAE